MASASSSPRRSGDGDETLGRPLVATVRGRAFTQIEDASAPAALPDYVAVTPPTSAPATPPRASGKTLEIKKLVSPARSPNRPPNGPAAPPVSIRTAATLVSAANTMGNALPSKPSPTVATTPGSLGRDLFNSASPSAAAAQTTRASLPSAPTTNKPPPLSPARASDDLDMQRKARRVSQWREEAERLSLRVRELEKENQQLRRLPMPPRTLSGGEYLDSLGASGTASLSDRENGDSPNGGDREHIRTRMRKSQSVASGFGYTGRTVAEAAAASHRSRSKRLGASSSSFATQPLQKYKSGYWNEQVGVKSSFSCNNLADMESRALAIERPQAPPQRPLTLLHKAHSTNTKSSAKANRDIAAMMRAPSMRKSDSFQRSSLEASGEEIATIHKQQLAIAKSFRGANVMRATPPVSHRKDRKELDIDELTDDGDDADADDTDEEDHVEVTSPRSYFEKSLRGVGGSFRLPNKSTTLAVAKRPTSSDVRMWVGTWNMGAADPFVDKNGIIDEQASASMLQQFVPHGYQLYVLGLQEGVSENAYHAVAAYLNRNETGTRYYRLELKNSDSLVANKNHPGEATIDAVRGRGDGAFVGTKFTGLAIFYAAPIQDKIKLLRAGVHKFNLTSGSKGGVAAALMINQTSIVFVNCHLDARNDGYRREQIRNLNANLGKVMGHPSFDLTEQFHHVVWMGDMNYRIVHLDPDIVLHMLEEGRNAELHDKFDGLLNDRRNGGVFDGFTEPNKFPDFYPTYKKFPKRGRVNYRSPSWSRLVYRVLYKEPFYKGGKVKKRVPGWCDRILIHSLLVGDSKLMPEKVVSPFEEQPTWIDNYRSVNEGDGMDVSDHSPVFATFTLSFPMQSDALNNVSPRQVRRNSRSLSSVSLRESTSSQSRSQVGGSYFDNPNVVRRIAANVSSRPVSTVLRVFNMQLFWNDNVVVPKRTRVVAPLIGEDIKQCDVIGERCQGTNGLNLSLNAVVQHTRQLEHLHMLVWVKHETISGHCTLSLKRIARQDEGGEVKFRVPLYNNSMRLYYDGYPLVLVFSVRSKTFAK